MTDEQTMTLVLKNQAGDYFLMPQKTLELRHVPAEHTAEVERAIAAARSGAGGDDVAGQLYGLAIAVGIGYFGTKAIMKLSEDGGGLTPQQANALLLAAGRGIVEGRGP
jgi:hypothetical protein